MNCSNTSSSSWKTTMKRSSLYGLGGIGKSSFVREYLTNHCSEYDAILYLHVGKNPEKLLISDEAVRLNTVEKRKEESVEEYLSRKLKALRKLSAEQNIVVVLDNYSPTYIEKTSAFFDFGWKILLVSRDELPEGFCPSLRLCELIAQDMTRLFIYYSF